MDQRYNIISERFLPSLKNTEKENPSLIILFSGVPGSGKSTLAKKMEQKYQAVTYNNDLVRSIVYKEKLDSENPDGLIKNYLLFFLETYNFPNKFIILDKSIDRSYKDICLFLEEHDLPYLIFSIELGGQRAIERVLSRNDKEDLFLVQKNMVRWESDFKDFKEKGKYDLLLDGENLEIDKAFGIVDHFLQAG